MVRQQGKTAGKTTRRSSGKSSAHRTARRNRPEKTIAELRAHLLAQKRTILQSLSTVAQDSLRVEETLFADTLDQAASDSDRTLNLRITGYHHSTLRQIDQALRRIREGTFMECESCGGAIAAARLRVNPATTLCIECKAELESEKHRFAADLTA